jgi:DNA-directed RNA polymerase specialized sigma24 family protein
VVTDLEPLINYAAGQVARAYPQVEFADVKQELLTHCVKNIARFHEYLGREDGKTLIQVALNREARKYAQKEREAVTGIPYEDQAWYTPNAIRRLLPDVYEYENWQTFQTLGMEGKSRPVEATGDRLAMIIDVKNALPKLLPDQRDILFESFCNHDSLEVIAERRSLSESGARKRLDRAVYAVREILGGPRPADPYEAVNGQFDTRSKGRKAMSNAASRRATEGDW